VDRVNTGKNYDMTMIDGGSVKVPTRIAGMADRAEAALVTDDDTIHGGSTAANRTTCERRFKKILIYQ